MFVLGLVLNLLLGPLGVKSTGTRTHRMPHLPGIDKVVLLPALRLEHAGGPRVVVEVPLLHVFGEGGLQAQPLSHPSTRHRLGAHMVEVVLEGLVQTRLESGLGAGLEFGQVLGSGQVLSLQLLHADTLVGISLHPNGLVVRLRELQDAGSIPRLIPALTLTLLPLPLEF